jgi:hypothetical protein
MIVVFENDSSFYVGIMKDLIVGWAVHEFFKARKKKRFPMEEHNVLTADISAAFDR